MDRPTIRSPPRILFLLFSRESRFRVAGNYRKTRGRQSVRELQREPTEFSLAAVYQFRDKRPPLCFARRSFRKLRNYGVTRRGTRSTYNTGCKRYKRRMLLIFPFSFFEIYYRRMLESVQSGCSSFECCNLTISDGRSIFPERDDRGNVITGTIDPLRYDRKVGFTYIARWPTVWNFVLPVPRTSTKVPAE